MEKDKARTYEPIYHQQVKTFGFFFKKKERTTKEKNMNKYE